MGTLIMGEKCKQCSHEWKPQERNPNPERCPRCGSPYWNRVDRETNFVKCEKCTINQADISINNKWYCLDCVAKYKLNGSNKKDKKNDNTIRK